MAHGGWQRATAPAMLLPFVLSSTCAVAGAATSRRKRRRKRKEHGTHNASCWRGSAYHRARTAVVLASFACLRHYSRDVWPAKPYQFPAEKKKKNGSGTLLVRGFAPMTVTVKKKTKRRRKTRKNNVAGMAGRHNVMSCILLYVTKQAATCLAA